MSFPSPWAALFAAALLLTSTWSYAGKSARVAEVQRLQDEADRLAARGAWSGVDRAYREALEIGIPLERSLHMLGAQAATQLGSVLDTWNRLRSAQAASDDVNMEVEQQLATIHAEYGLVTITVLPSWKAPIMLENKDLGFSPTAQATVARAAESLLQNRSYRGLLPHGRYVLGTEEFSIVGGPLVEVTLKKSGEWSPPAAAVAPPTPVTPSPPSSVQERTTKPTTMSLSLGPEAVEPDAVSTDVATIKVELLGLVEVSSVDVIGLETCWQAPTDTPDELAEHLRRAFDSTEEHVWTRFRDGAREVVITTETAQAAEDVQRAAPPGTKSVTLTWCDPIVVRRIELSVEAGTLLDDLDADLREVLLLPEAVRLGLTPP